MKILSLTMDEAAGYHPVWTCEQVLIVWAIIMVATIVIWLGVKLVRKYLGKDD
jgi:hypothetical protein